MQEVTIAVYEYEELNDTAKEKARFTIERHLYDFEFEEWAWMQRKFNELLSHYCFINYDDLCELCNSIGYWLTIDFIFEYKYHGLRDTHYVKKAFQKFIENKWENFFFEECDIVEFCESNEILFFEDGTIYKD